MHTRIQIVVIAILFSLPSTNILHAQGLGDINGDAQCNLLDGLELFNLINTGTYDPLADLNIDGFVNTLDIQPMADLLQYGTGDMNRDGSIDPLDILGFRIALVFGPFDVIADMNRDGNVDLLDVPDFLNSLVTGMPTHGG